MADKNNCAGCMRDGDTNRAPSWCSDCSEPVCVTCAKFHKKLSPPHKIVPLEHIKRPSSDIFKLSGNCRTHNKEKIILFCCQHDKVVCDTCLSESHQSCKSIISIEKASKGVRDGTVILDLEKRLGNLTKVYENILSKQVNNQDNMEKCKEEIKTTISEIKNIKECQRNILNDREDIQSTLESVTSWKKDIDLLNPHASDIHLFQAVKYLDAKAHEEELKIHKMIKLKFCVQKNLSNLQTFCPSLGSIMVENTPVLASDALDIHIQAQDIVKSQDDKNKLSLICSFTTDKLGQNVAIYRGCFLPASRLLLSPFTGNKLFVCNLDGANAKSINLDYGPHSVTLYDKNRALVTSWNGRFMQTINLTTLKPGRKITIGTPCGAVTSLDGKICLSTSENSLTLTNLNGDILKKTMTKLEPFDISMNRAGDIYFTRQFGHVYILPSRSNEPFIYSEMSGGHGVAVGDHNCIFVAQCGSNKIIKIYRNNEVNCIESLLNADDGINSPTALSFDTETKQLMIVSENSNCIRIYKT
ncbi:TRIM28 [Mytilus coruscus]|uniref:TRIM28 n=1 Tax=Mytilus coruscus TaxID=42192 RepID=A0A6J7ZW00_MYTCO|nr:TRIM28 [Mytilus coruscus]